MSANQSKAKISRKKLPYLNTFVFETLPKDTQDSIFMLFLDNARCSRENPERRFAQARAFRGLAGMEENTKQLRPLVS